MRNPGMRYRILIAAMTFACLVNSPAPPEKRVADIVTTPELIPALWRMFEDAGLGSRATEEAAFVTVRNGRLTLVRWPEAGVRDTARWYGTLPDGVLAIVHTHPNWEPLPSTVDIQTAQRSHLPVYVITATQISKTVGGPVEVVLNGDWNPVRIACASFAKAGR
jgi:hypothetical protein